MKKISLLLLIFISAISSSFASHYVGGEIYWRCIQGTGKYIFYMDYYRDCGSSVGPQLNVSLSVSNTPRPNNNSLANIPMTFIPPDPGSPVGPFGGLAVQPTCQGCAGSSPISCVVADDGTLEKFSFRSQPITLAGKPPSGNANDWLNGWVFSWQAPCCRSSDVTNIQNTGSTALFKAIMYGDGRASQDPCYDNSPEFKEQPASLICDEYDFQFNHNATDLELDSLNFSWANVVNSTAGTNYTPVFNQWAAGFSINNPTPNTAANARNKPATIDPKSGAINMFVVLPANIGPGGNKIYVTSARVDAYGCDINGNTVRKASIFRDMPFNIFNCPKNTFTYNDQNGDPINITEVNTAPYIKLNSTAGALNFDTTIYAGDYVSIAFLAEDSNVSRCSPTLLTEVTVEPSGFQFDKNFNDPQGNCPIKPCATLTPAPTGAPVKRLKQYSTVGTRFDWQTTCDHLDISSLLGASCQQLSEGVFKFIMKTYDDFCPVPAVNYATITITLKAPEPLGPPIIRCVNVRDNNDIVVTWTGPEFPDTTNSFDSYELHLGQRAIGSTSGFSFPPNSPLAIGIKDYQGTYTIPGNLLAPGLEYAVRMRTVFGCKATGISDYSEIVASTNRLTGTHTGTTPPTDPNRLETEVTLNWNTLFDVPANKNPIKPGLLPSFMLNSWDGIYYIYQRHSPYDSGPWELVDSIMNPNIKTWKQSQSPVCDDTVAFKIATRDTVGNCMSFSNIVLKNMKSIIPPVNPKILEYSVLPNGDVYLKWSLNNTSADSFVIYESDAAGNRINKLDSIVVPQDDYTHVGAGADLIEKHYVVVPFDTCNKTVEGPVTNVSTSMNLGSIVYIGPDSCEVAVDLNWSEFKGFINTPIVISSTLTIPADPIVSYEIYSVVSGVTNLIGTVNGVGNRSYSYPVLSNTTYDFYVVGKTAGGLTATSNRFNITTGDVPKKYVVAPPDVRCVRFVGGVVELEWIPPVNPFNNFIEYKFQRLEPTGWKTVATEVDINVTTIVDPNPLPELKYRMVSVSNYCKKPTDSIPAGFVTPIYLTVVNGTSSEPQLELDWTRTGINYSNPFEILRDSSYVAPSSTFNVDTTVQQSILNFTDRDSCTKVGRYFVQVQDVSGCYSISNTASEIFRDVDGPDKQFIDYVTVDYTDINNLAVQIVWSKNSSKDVKRYKIERPLTTFPITNITIDTSGETTSVIEYVDPTDTTYTYTIFAEDSCSGISEEPFDKATTIDINSKFLICDSAVELTWNRYDWFRSGSEVLYEIYTSQTKVFTDFVKVGSTTKNSYIHKGVQTGDNYFYVKALDFNGAGPFFSNSNLTHEFVEYPDPPAYQYMHSVYVNSPNFIEIQCYVDTAALVKGYAIYRGVDSSALVKIDQVGTDAVLDGAVNFSDYNVVSDEGSYYYRINALDSCGNLSIASNLGKSIYLVNTTDNLALTNTLKWTAYEDWANGVDYYLIYKAEKNKFGVDAYDTLYVEPGMGNVITYTDDVSDYLDDKDNFLKNGQYCYYVVAVENGRGVPSDPSIGSGMALSNAVCTNMQPAMYIPNAFSPGTAVNNVFRPEGVYFDFTRYEMIIYNRWGEVVFETNDYYKGWDGSLSGGKYAPIGTYVYSIRFIDSNGEERSRKGTLTIVR